MDWFSQLVNLALMDAVKNGNNQPGGEEQNYIGPCMDEPNDPRCAQPAHSGINEMQGQLHVVTENQAQLSTEIKQLQNNNVTIAHGVASGFNITFCILGLLVVILLLYGAYMRAKINRLTELVERVNMNTLK